MPVASWAAYRVTWDRHGPWWFSTRSDDPEAAGRFDLERPRGTCYLADDAIGALVEKLVDPDDAEPLLSRADLERLVVWSGRLTRPPTLADTTARASRIPKELGTVVPYDLAWAWADALDAVGRGGLVSWLRLDPAATRGLSVFGTAGAPAVDDPWPKLVPRPARSWVTELLDAIDILEEPPAAGDLAWSPDPS